jgi:hypothetical protein
MDITNIPKIAGYTLPNSVIYGLSLSSNYSASPSKLTLNLVSNDGKYTLPTLKDTAQIKFGNFTFKGRVWGYNLKESAQEKTLDVEIIDNSLILDQYYVVLWKRGLLGYPGKTENIEKTFNFSDETVLVPKKNASFTSFEEKKLGTQKISRPSRSKLDAGSYGNVIILGREKFADSACDLPDTYYTFNDLVKVLPKLNSKNLPSNSLIKGTYEGSLREVLNSWCSDLGFDFYWDYSTDSLNFYAVNAGITIQLPPASTNNSKIISRESSASMEGTFRQYGLSYTALPKQPLKTISFSDTYTVLYGVPAISLSYLLRRNGIVQDLNIDRGAWGSGRTQRQFITSALVGFVSRALRDFHCLDSNHQEVIGYNTKNTIKPDKSQMINFLISNGFQPMILELRKLDDENLSNHDISLVSYDESLADKWHEIEQELLRSIGGYYRIPDSSGSFFYCNDKFSIEISISVDPEGESQTFGDGKTVKKIFSRGGQLSHDQASALEELQYDTISENIAKCAPTHILLKEGGLSAKLVAAKLIDKERIKKVSHIVISPNFKKIVQPLINLEVTPSSGNNPMELTWGDQKQSNDQEGRQNCAYEKRLENGSCLSAEEEARKKAIKAVGGQTQDEKNPDNFVSGLQAKGASACTIKLQSGNVKIYAPSDSIFQVVCSYSINANKISDSDTDEFLSWDTNIPKSFFDDVSEIRISNENVTDPFEDTYRTPRKSKNFPLPPPVIASQPQKTIKYVFAGEPVDVNLSPSQGLSSLDISLSSEGFTTSATFSSRPPNQSKADNTLRLVNSQLNRTSFNAT